METASVLRLSVSLALAGILLLLSPGKASADEPVTAEVTEFGIYAIGPILHTEPDTEYGVPRLFGEEITLQESTHEVPGQIGISFGIRYKVHGGTEGLPNLISIVVRYPPQGLYNPERSGPSYFDEQTLFAATDEPMFITWDFIKQWHIEPGIWNIEIWHDGEKLAEEWFEVITPPIS